MIIEIKVLLDEKIKQIKNNTDLNDTEKYEILKKIVRDFEDENYSLNSKEYNEYINYICDEIGF